MNIKKVMLILLIIAALSFSITAISAESDDNSIIEEANNADLVANDSSDHVQEVDEDTSNDTVAPPTTTAQPKTTTKTKLKATAQPVYKEYKKKGTFKIKIKNSKKKPMKKLKINVKVYTGKKAKTIKLTTNSKGIATLNTKNLKVGNHKVIITSTNPKYSINKKSNIFIGKKKTMTLKINQEKKFKNGDFFHFYQVKKDGQDDKGVYVKNLRVYKGSLMGARSHFAIKAKYTFKNLKTKKLITKYSTSQYMLQTKLIKGYTPIKVKVTYLGA